MIRKDKLKEVSDDASIRKTSSESDTLNIVHELESRALSAFTDNKDSKDNE